MHGRIMFQKPGSIHYTEIGCKMSCDVDSGTRDFRLESSRLFYLNECSFVVYTKCWNCVNYRIRWENKVFDSAGTLTMHPCCSFVVYQLSFSSLVFFHLNKLPFLGFLQFKVGTCSCMNVLFRKLKKIEVTLTVDCCVSIKVIWFGCRNKEVFTVKNFAVYAVDRK